MQGLGRRRDSQRRVATLLFEKVYPTLLETLSGGPDCRMAEIWSFDDAPTRRAMESELAAQGIRARCRSALKPLVCAFVEEIPTASLSRAVITYPCHPAALPQRFLREAYPLPAMFPEVGFDFQPAPPSDGMPVYHLHLTYDGGQERHLTVQAPNAVSAEGVLSPCGWLIGDGQGSRVITPYERIFRDVMALIEATDWRPPPCFEELNIAVTLPSRDEELGGGKILSLTELLHEDLYFSAQEQFQRRFGRPAGDRSLHPGQIVPEVVLGPEYSVRVELRPWDSGLPDVPVQPLATAQSCPGPRQLAEELARIPGQAFSARSDIGRRIEARYLPGPDRAVMISAGQHANEVSGPVGALRAGQELARRAGAHFAICPLENPDGYVLRDRLAQDNPRHLLHAARYTALGDDLEFRHGPISAEAGPAGIRDQARALSGALFHISLHGYPAHEWLRPLNGYLPRGYEDWTLPRGFRLILRHHPGWAAPARRLIEGVAARLGQLPGLTDFNHAQIALAQRLGVGPGEMIGGFSCRLDENARMPLPLVLVTDYPDETLSGEAFIAAHEAQRAATIAAYEAFQDLDSWDWPLA